MTRTRTKTSQLLRDALDASAITEPELARRSGVGVQSVERYVEGEVDPSATRLFTLLEAMGISSVPIDMIAKEKIMLDPMRSFEPTADAPELSALIAEVARAHPTTTPELARRIAAARHAGLKR